jgi:hypothetical protein
MDHKHCTYLGFSIARSTNEPVRGSFIGVLHPDMVLDSAGETTDCGEGVGDKMGTGGGTGATNLPQEFLGELCDLSLEVIPLALLVEACRRE